MHIQANYMQSELFSVGVCLIFHRRGGGPCFVTYMWPLTRKRTTTVFRWTAKAVGYPLGTRWRRWWKRWRRWKSRWVFFFTHWRRWKKPLGNFSQTVGNVGKSLWVLFPYPLKALRKAVGKMWPSTGKQWIRWLHAHGTVLTRSHDTCLTRLACAYAKKNKRNRVACLCPLLNVCWHGRPLCFDTQV